MVQKAILLAACGALALASTPVWAVDILNDNFEYENQAAFEAAWPVIGTGPNPSLVLTTDQASTGGFKSVFIGGTAPPTANGDYRNRRQVAETGALDINTKITWSFDFYDTAPTASPARNYANLQDGLSDLGTNSLVAMGFNNNQLGSASGGQYYMARILGYSPETVDPDGGPNEEGTLGSGAFFKLNDFIEPNRTEGWHNLKVVISTDDGLSTDYEFYVDDILAERVSNVGTTASLRSYDIIALGSGLTNANTTAYIDNMILTVEVNNPSVAGDYNGDGFVDAADYTVWADNFGQSGSGLPGDGNGDGVVDAADYTVWADNFGQGTPPGGVAVPEPAMLSLVLPGLALLRRRRA